MSNIFHLRAAQATAETFGMHRRKVLDSLALLALAAIAVMQSLPALSQTNWPSFRGPFASGLAAESDTALTWNIEKSENIAWRTPIPGLGHSSPVIWRDRLFVTTAVNTEKSAPLKVGLYGDPESAQDNEAQQWQVLCLNKASGKILWQVTSYEGRPKVP